MRHALLLLLAPLLASGCAQSRLALSEADQARARRELTGESRFLRVACNVGPLFSDTDKALLIDRPANEVDLVEEPDGRPIRPTFERVLAPGTPVRVRDIEFPTPLVMAQRVLVTPRYHPWVYLEVEGDRRPYVIVLPQEVKSFEDVRAELERYFAADDPRPALSALAPDLRELVLRKEVAPGMSARAVEMAWGLPDRKVIDRPQATEDWYWNGGKRHVILREDRLDQIDR